MSKFNFSLGLFVYVHQFTMEMAGNDSGNMPKSYSLNMFKDFVPMGVFSETNQGESYCNSKQFIICFLFSYRVCVTI